MKVAGRKIAVTTHEGKLCFRGDEGLARLLETLGLDTQRLVVDLLTLGLRQLFLAPELEHVAIEARHGLSGLDEIAGLRDPLDPAREARGYLGDVAAEDRAGGGDQRRHVLGDHFRNRYKRRVVLPFHDRRQEAATGGKQDLQDNAMIHNLHQETLASEIRGGATETGARYRSSPRRRMLGRSNSVNTVLTLMPPTITVARPR